MHSLNQALPCLTQPTSNMNTKGRNSISILSWNTARIVLLPWAFGPFFCLLFVGGPPPPLAWRHAKRMDKILFISSWNRAGALATPNGMTFHLNTLP